MTMSENKKDTHVYHGDFDAIDPVAMIKAWIKPITFEEEDDGGNDLIYYRGSTWIHTHGFIKGALRYRIYRSELNHFAVDAKDAGKKDYGWCGEIAPTIGIYPSWDEMITHLAEMHSHSGTK